MTSLRDTTADAAAELTRIAGELGIRDGSVRFDRDQAREARSAIRDALSTFDAVERITTRQHDRNILRQRAARLKYVLTMLGPD